MLLDRGADVNAQGGLYGNALQAASDVVTIRWCRYYSIKGRTSMLKENIIWQCPTSSITGGNDTVVQILLDRGADINAQGGQYGNALQAASECGHDMVVQMLLDRGADVTAHQGGGYRNALLAAPAAGHEKGGADAARSPRRRRCNALFNDQGVYILWQCPTKQVVQMLRDKIVNPL